MKMRLIMVSPHLVCAPKKELFEKRIAFFQFAERKNRSVSGTDLRRIRKRHRTESGERIRDFPFAPAGKIASPNRIGEDEIADEEKPFPLEEVTERSARMSGNLDRIEGDAGKILFAFVEHLDPALRDEKAIEKHLGTIGVRPFDEVNFFPRCVNRTVERPDEIIDAENVVEMTVRQENEVEPADLPDTRKDLFGGIARIDEKILFAFDDVDVGGKQGAGGKFPDLHAQTKKERDGSYFFSLCNVILLHLEQYFFSSIFSG